MENNKTIINQERTRELIRKAQEGCNQSKEMLLEENEKLVRSVAKKMRCHPEYEDILQVGRIGLIKTIDNFNLSMDVCFSTYAVPVILGEIKRYLRDNKMIKVSRSIQSNIIKIKSFLELYQKENSEEARISDIVKGTGLEEEDVILALGSEKDYISLDKPLGSDEGKVITILDSLEDANNFFERYDDKEAISKYMECLTNQEKKIIIARYMSEQTQSQLAKELGISQAHVSRIEKKALKKIKEVV